MLTHRHSHPQKPERVFVLGGSGFFGKALIRKLQSEGVAVFAPSSAELDLSAPEAVHFLGQNLQAQDSLVILSALTPDRGRDIATFMANLRMVQNVCAALAQVTPAHVVYFSSDAVYPFETGLTSESSLAAPVDLYGVMHRSRELMLSQTLGDQLCILRPSLVYGAGDSHNSYGPNRFRRQASKEGKINIGGEGEETRDHVYIDDIVALTIRVLNHRSTGILNLASGRSIDFGTLARIVASHFETPVSVCPSPRSMPATHRHFDTTHLIQAFPDFAFTPLEQGLAAAHGSA